MKRRRKRSKAERRAILGFIKWGLVPGMTDNRKIIKWGLPRRTTDNRKREPMAKTIHRSSKTGRTVTKAYAKRHKATTQAETVRPAAISFVDATNWARVLLARTAVLQIQPDGKHVLESEHRFVMASIEVWVDRLEPVVVKAGR